MNDIVSKKLKKIYDQANDLIKKEIALCIATDIQTFFLRKLQLKFSIDLEKFGQLETAAKDLRNSRKILSELGIDEHTAAILFPIIKQENARDSFVRTAKTYDELIQAIKMCSDFYKEYFDAESEFHGVVLESLRGYDEKKENDEPRVTKEAKIIHLFPEGGPGKK